MLQRLVIENLLLLELVNYRAKQNKRRLFYCSPHSVTVVPAIDRYNCAIDEFRLWATQKGDDASDVVNLGQGIARTHQWVGAPDGGMGLLPVGGLGQKLVYRVFLVFFTSSR